MTTTIETMTSVYRFIMDLPGEFPVFVVLSCTVPTLRKLHKVDCTYFTSTLHRALTTFAPGAVGCFAELWSQCRSPEAPAAGGRREQLLKAKDGHV